jgi:hypothetical protein
VPRTSVGVVPVHERVVQVGASPEGIVTDFTVEMKVPLAA